MSEIVTSCEKCVFATWDDNIQTGCKVGRLDKFAKQNTELKMIETDDKQHFLINNRICLMCCPQEKVDRLDMKKPIEDMRKLISIKVEAYVVATDENSFEELQQSIDSLINQELKPTIINVVLNTDKIARAKIVRHFNKFDCVWNVTYISDVGADGSRNSVEWALDHAIASCKSPFYCVFMAGDVAPQSYLRDIDVALNDNLERFSLLLPADDYWRGAFVQTALHKHLSGNMPQCLEQHDDGELVATCLFDKVEYIAEKMEQPYMIKKVAEVCPAILQ